MGNGKVVVSKCNLPESREAILNSELGVFKCDFDHGIFINFYQLASDMSKR